MDLANAWLHPFWAFALPIAASVPLGWSMFRSLDRPEGRAGKGLDALPLFLLRLLGRREPAKMDWKRYAFAFLAFNAALFVITFGLLYVQQHLPLNPDGKGSLGALGLQGRRGHRPPRRRHGGRLQHRLLVRHQHEPPALLGRAAPVVLQPARLHRLADVRDPGRRPGGDAGDAPRAAGRSAHGRLLPRPDAEPRSSCSCPWPS